MWRSSALNFGSPRTSDWLTRLPIRRGDTQLKLVPEYGGLAVESRGRVGLHRVLETAEPRSPCFMPMRSRARATSCCSAHGTTLIHALRSSCSTVSPRRPMVSCGSDRAVDTRHGRARVENLGKSRHGSARRHPRPERAPPTLVRSFAQRPRPPGSPTKRRCASSSWAEAAVNAPCQGTSRMKEPGATNPIGRWSVQKARTTTCTGISAFRRTLRRVSHLLRPIGSTRTTRCRPLEVRCPPWPISVTCRSTTPIPTLRAVR